MREFSYVRRCPKCGSHNGSVTYRSKRDYGAESLFCVCSECGYSWQMKAKTTEEKTAE